MSPLLSLHVRQKVFSGPAVLADVSIHLGEREVVALLGPSGCGKTTLLRIVAGLDRRFEGRLAWRDDVVPRIGMVFQQPLLLPWRTVRQNLRLALPDPTLMPGAERLLESVGLAGAPDKWPGELSLGMARRVSIARALAIEPRVLLLDEPFVSLDPSVAALAREVVLNAWRSRPIAIVLVTHEAAEAAALADRVLVLSRDPGGIVAEIVIPPEDRRTLAPQVVAAVMRAQAEASL